MQYIDNTRLLIEDGHSGRTQTETADLAGTSEIQARIELGLGHDTHADAAGNGTLRLASLPDAAAVLVHQLAHRDTEWQFHAAGIVHVAADAIQFRPIAAGVTWVVRIGGHADRFEPIRSTIDDVRHARHRLNVIHD